MIVQTLWHFHFFQKWRIFVSKNGGPLGGATLGARQKSKQYATGDIWLRPAKSGPVGLKKLTFHTFHHVQYNGCFKHMNYRLSMSNKPCHTTFFSFLMVGLQSWVLRVTKSSRFLRYPQDTSRFLCFYHVQINTYNLL